MAHIQDELLEATMKALQRVPRERIKPIKEDAVAQPNGTIVDTETGEVIDKGVYEAKNLKEKTREEIERDKDERISSKIKRAEARRLGRRLRK